MKHASTATVIALALLGMLLDHPVASQGIMIENAATGSLLEAGPLHLEISIVDQVCIVTSTQRFLNTTADTLYPKYGYPLPETASATRLRWMLEDSIWNTASMVAEPQDTTLPGVGDNDPATPAILGYLGTTPLYFRILQGIPPGTGITMELTTVELLHYANARVEMWMDHDLSELMSTTIPGVSVEVRVRSQRGLTGIELLGTGAWAPPTDITLLAADTAVLFISDTDVPASHGFMIGYDLDPLAYGTSTLSTFLPDSLVKCDELGQGFFVLLIEPEPTSAVIAKDFVIVIDRSGSMSGTKIQEARSAASFMVNNLNAGDRFNLIAFSSTNTAWSSGLQPFNAANMLSALNWIDQITASGGTNILGAVTLGIDQYITSGPDHAKPLIFLTDGMDGNNSTTTILNATQQMRLAIAPALQLFTFGVGYGYNEQLLNQLAVQNNGVAQFISSANFAEVMNDFYTQIQNPVLLSPTATFDRPDIDHTYPQPLVGLFVGQQMVIVGRYDEPGPVELQLDGFASGQPVTFNYSLDLTGDHQEDLQFIPKIWAQKAIQALMNEYYSHPVGSSAAIAVQDSIISFSMCYGVGSPFTSFVDDGDGGGGTAPVGMEEEERTERPVLLVFPEPAAAGTTLTLDLSAFAGARQLVLRVYDSLGRLVFEADLAAHAGDLWTWNGLGPQGQALKGQLVLQLFDGQTIHTGRATRL